MSIGNHPDYKEELQYLKGTINYIDQFINSIKKKQQESKEDMKEAYEVLDFLDSSQSYITILVNARYLDKSSETINKVTKARDKPYFSRIDFKDDRDEQPTSYYIGKLSLFKDDNEPLIIDWRSPVASLYYDGRIGEVSYEAEEGTITGNLSLKRQYTIEDGELQDFFDVDITTNDELLQASLRDTRDDKLKDIVSTIQREQNKIIRADLTKPLIVQGAAGSGKTTIALHRIAYLIYTYEKSFDPNNFMIIAPNNLFLDYISDVLPELGVEDARQTTFTDFCLDLLNLQGKVTVTELNEKLSIILEEKDVGLLRWSSFFKGSFKFKGLIDNYLKDVKENMLPKEDILLEEYTLMSQDELTNAFYNEYNYLPIHKRFDQIKKKLSSRAKQKKELIIESVKEEYEKIISKARKEEGSEKAVSLMDERDEKIERIKAGAKKVSQNFSKNIKKQNAFNHYKKILKDKELLKKYSEEEIEDKKAEYMAETAKKSFKKKELESEDLAPLLYLKAQLEGFKETIESSNVIIDEAQDFNLFEFYVLKHVLKTDNFTLLGDISQGVHGYRGISNWEEVNKTIFSNEATSLTLKQSYRTTVEIMELSNNVLKKGVGNESILAEPVVRHGEKPIVNVVTQKDNLIDGLKKKILELQEQGYASIAIIGKTLTECKKIHELLDMKDITLLSGKEAEYQGGVVIVPSYAAKGLEFDAVTIVSLDEAFYETELDAKLLYVAMTRAIHNLSTFTMMDQLTSYFDD
ncbi:RNA polymerase recycling motor HelD [Natranaerobius trueperi]|uniref:DNA helicase n=1 Tax=Natranaerobius trueperi TaxID=759412 RepID=A0A226C185_9FIRM|nr:RNA polymerase recycling motor HelD [Natranaerobius trueperi]OWZ85023.1 DNA helicase [Natranaerobius trueperi]